MMKKILLLMALTLISPLSQAELDSADDDAMETYSAELGEEDYFNSKGTRLKTVAEILQQDRANVHEAIAIHRGDSNVDEESFFASKANRVKIKSMLNNGYISQETQRKILKGWPVYITVSVHRNSIDVE
jgi:hypothetical protein